MNDISTEELRDLLAGTEVINLIDVREDYEFEEDNLGGTLIPLGEIQDRLDELADIKDQDIYVHCRSGKRSDTAKKILMAHGFSKVHNVLGGMLAYRAMD
jgi:rhodanese-related sulfurtransferase